MNLFATIAKNLEPLLADELTTMGMQGVRPTGGGVHFTGELEDAYRVCLFSRLANAVLVPLATFDAPHEDALYAGVRAIRWSEHMTLDDTFAVDFTSSGSRLNHTHYGALKVKDAIVDQWRDDTGRRPSIDTDLPKLRVNVHVRKNVATVSLDLAGKGLHQRGWRTETIAASIKENLAAAILWRAGWPKMAADGLPLLDPMCGAGTFLIEAYMMAMDIAPGLYRRGGFTLQTWRQHDPDVWSRLIDEAVAREDAGRARDNPPTIVGHDVSRKAVAAARANLENIEAVAEIRVDAREVREIQPVGPAPGLVVANPPYGARLGDEQSARVAHERLGESLRDRFLGWKASVITGSKELGFALGMRATKTYSVYNGPLECKLIHFDVEPSRFYAER